VIRRFHIHGVTDARTQLPVGYIITEATANGVKPLPDTYLSSWNEVRIYFSDIGAKRDEMSRAKHSLDAYGHALVSVMNGDLGTELNTLKSAFIRST
jgi:hypothetical protein